MTTLPGALAPITPDELATVRREYRAASLLPKRAYHDAAIFDWERQHVLRTDWVMVAREEDVAEPGTYTLVELDGENIIVVRGRDHVLRAFFNVCRHRGTAVAEDACGKVVRFQCPYHAWIYDLDGTLIRAKHTEDLDDFSFERFGLAPDPASTRGRASSSSTSTPRRRRWRPSWATWSSTGAASTSHRCARPSASSTTSTRTGSSSPRTTRSATTARASTRSSTS